MLTDLESNGTSSSYLCHQLTPRKPIIISHQYIKKKCITKRFFLTVTWIREFLCWKKSFKRPKRYLEFVNRRKDNTMVKRKKKKRTINDHQTLHIKLHEIRCSGRIDSSSLVTYVMPTCTCSCSSPYTMIRFPWCVCSST